MKPNHINKVVDFPEKIFSQLEANKSVVYKYDNPVDPTSVVIEKTRQFSLFSMHSMKSLGIMFGYLFTFEHKWVKISDTFFFVKRLSSKNLDFYTGTDISYQSEYINVYTSQDGCCLITGNNLYNILDREMIRRKKIKDEI
jgi:hypothetical protein